MKVKFISLLLTLVMLFSFENSFACSAFTIKNQQHVFMFKTYEWHFGEGIMMFNPGGTKRISMPVAGEYQELRWRSKYANLTFNQYGQNLPNGGINEKGLAIEILWLHESEYPNVNGQKALNELQWIQYALDNFTTIDELVKDTKDIIVAPFYAKTHYYITDATGKSAVVEYIDGKRVVSLGNELPYSAITNSTYKNSLAGLEGNSGGCFRFNTICNSLNNLPEQLSTEQAYTEGFNILDKVGAPQSQWRIGYDLKNKEIRFKTLSNSEIKIIKISDFINNNSKPVFIDLASPSSITFKDFKTVEVATSGNLLKNAFEKLRIPVPAKTQKFISRHLKTGRRKNKISEFVNKYKGVGRSSVNVIE